MKSEIDSALISSGRVVPIGMFVLSSLSSANQRWVCNILYWCLIFRVGLNQLLLKDFESHKRIDSIGFRRKL